MEINKVLDMLAKELKENNKNSYVNRKDRIKEQKDDFFIQKNLEQSQAKPKSRFGKDDKVITDILKDVNNTISTVGLLTVSSINKGFSEQNKILKKMAKTNTGLGIKEKYDPLSTGKEQREEIAFIEEKRTNELLEDILVSLGGKNNPVKSSNSILDLSNTSLKTAGAVFAAGAIPAIALGLFNSLNKLIGTESTLFKLFKGGNAGKPLFELIKGSSFITNMTEFGKSLPLVNKITEAFSATGAIGKGLRLGLGGLKVLAKAPLLELEAIFEGFKGLWQGEGWAEKFKLMSAGILGSIVGFPAIFGNLVGDWLDIEWMKNLEFGKKDWWIEQIDAFRDGLSYSLGLKDPPKVKPLEFQSSHTQNFAPSHGVANNSLPPEARAILATIAGTESPDYDVLYGGERFDDYSKHPNIKVPIKTGPNAGNVSTAAGKYQFLKGTWDDQAKKLGLIDFSPMSQDLAAWDLAKTKYNQSTKRDLASDIKSLDPIIQGNIGKVLSGIWTSLPSGIEATTNNNRFSQELNKNLAAATQDLLTPIKESAKTTTIIEAKKNEFTSVNESQQPSVIGKIGNDITNIISNSTLNANFPYQSESKMKFAFGVA